MPETCNKLTSKVGWTLERIGWHMLPPPPHPGYATAQLIIKLAFIQKRLLIKETWYISALLIMIVTREGLDNFCLQFFELQLSATAITTAT